MPTSPTDDRPPIDSARELIAAWQSSGLSMRAFATQRGMSANRLYYWRQKLDSDASLVRPPAQHSVSSAFIRLPASAMEPSERGYLSIQLPNRISIHLRSDVSPGQVAAVVAALSKELQSC